MNRPIEDIERDIKSTKEKIHEQQSDLIRLKKELCKAMSAKFTEETGIGEGDKFKKSVKWSDFLGKYFTHNIYGFFIGFEPTNWGDISLVYADVKKDGTRSKNTHNTSIEVKDFSGYEKV